MTKIILKQDQFYVSELSENKFGKKGSCVNVEESFLKLIKGKYEIFEERQEQDLNPKKPLSNMNKTELISFAKKSGIKLSNNKFDDLTKAKIMDLLTIQ